MIRIVNHVLAQEITNVPLVETILDITSIRETWNSVFATKEQIAALATTSILGWESAYHVQLTAPPVPDQKTINVPHASTELILW